MEFTAMISSNAKRSCNHKKCVLCFKEGELKVLFPITSRRKLFKERSWHYNVSQKVIYERKTIESGLARKRMV